MQFPKVLHRILICRYDLDFKQKSTLSYVFAVDIGVTCLSSVALLVYKMLASDSYLLTVYVQTSD